MTRRALVSVTDKSRLDELLPLSEAGWEFISTGGTATELRRLGFDPVIDMSDVTGFPEMMNGRLKTLHPKVFGGILANRHEEEHLASAEKHGIQMIDLVAVNLYDFEGNPSIEQIDIGGPSLLRAAAKNHESVIVLVDPRDYRLVVDNILHNGDLHYPPFRRQLARQVFEHTARYDRAIADWL